MNVAKGSSDSCHFYNDNAGMNVYTNGWVEGLNYSYTSLEQFLMWWLIKYTALSTSMNMHKAGEVFCGWHYLNFYGRLFFYKITCCGIGDENTDTC